MVGVASTALARWDVPELAEAVIGVDDFLGSDRVQKIRIAVATVVGAVTATRPFVLIDVPGPNVRRDCSASNATIHTAETQAGELCTMTVLFPGELD